jgi:2'-5' RNA ligase
MGHRIFIAINLPEDVKRELSLYQENWPSLPARWTKKENLHITLVFLGYVNSEELPEICQIVRDVAARNDSFDLNLKKITYGPPKNNPPRMVWTEGEKSKELGKLHGDLENSLCNRLNVIEDKGKPYSPHITLGRIKAWELQRMDPEDKPEINEGISFNFEVNSIEVMESFLKKKGPDYMVLESCPFKK